jgi:hypothetical protein
MPEIEQYVKVEFVPHTKHTVSITTTNRLMLFSEIIAVCCENHAKHISTLFRKNAEVFSVAAGGIYSCHCALKQLNWQVQMCA